MAATAHSHSLIVLTAANQVPVTITVPFLVNGQPSFVYPGAGVDAGRIVVISF